MSRPNTRSTRKNGIDAKTNGHAIADVTVESTPRRRQRQKSEREADSAQPKENGTPPKNGRYSKMPNPNYSPSTLLNRMSLTTTSVADDEDVENEVKPILPARGKIENARKSLHISQTDSLCGRDQELNDLTIFLSKNLKAGSSASMYVSGQPGKYRAG